MASDVAQMGSARSELCVKQHTNTQIKEWVEADHKTSLKCMERRRNSHMEHFPNKFNGQGPPGPGKIGARQASTIVARQLEPVHLNPGPARRDRAKITQQTREKLNTRRKKKRMMMKRPTKMEAKIPIVTWNLQGVSAREQNRSRPKNIIAHFAKQKWEVTRMSEIRRDRMGVIWIGSGKETTAVIHSFKIGFILRGSALDEWVRKNQNKDFMERATSMENSIC